MVDRNLQVSYLIVDEMHHEHPELLKDQYWDEVLPNELPYTVATERFRETHPEPSTAKIEVPKASAMTSAMSGVRITDPVGTSDIKSSSGMASMQAVSYKFQNQPQTPDEEVRNDDLGDNMRLSSLYQQFFKIIFQFILLISNFFFFLITIF